VQRGGNVYKRTCASCHGPKGDMVAGHDLGSAKVHGDLAAIVAVVKSPKAPMPKMFPEVLTEQNVADVAAYVQQELGR
jgi:alcohol dehydrogenase (cytochrome c)